MLLTKKMKKKTIEEITTNKTLDKQIEHHKEKVVKHIILHY